MVRMNSLDFDAGRSKMDGALVESLRCVVCGGAMTLWPAPAAQAGTEVLACRECRRAYLCRDGLAYMCRPSTEEAEELRAAVDGELRVDDPDTSTHRHAFDGLYAGYGDLFSRDALDERKANVPLTRRSTEVQLDAILRHFPSRPGARVLDHGCGFGFDLEVYASRYPRAELFGMDISPFMLGRVIHCRVPAKVVVAFGETIPFPDKFFDFIASHEVMEHIENPAAALAEIGRVLKPGGQAVITTPNASSFYQRVLEPMDRYLRSRKGPIQDAEPYDVPVARRRMNAMSRRGGLLMRGWDYTCPFYITLTRLTPLIRRRSSALLSTLTSAALALYPLAPRIPGLRSLVCEQTNIFLEKELSGQVSES